MKAHPRVVKEYDWQSLDEGETVRLHCDSWQCKDKISKALTITRTSTGCIYNCYRCGLEGSPGVIGLHSSPSQALRRIKEMRHDRHSRTSNNNNSYTVRLPRDFVSLLTGHNIPPQAHAWIYKYELDDQDVYDYNIGYSYRLERTIFPIYENNKLIAWQGRDIYYDKNKELFKKGILKRSPLKYYTEYNNIYYKNNNIKLYFKILNLNLNKNNKNIILVEDIISCIKLYNKFKCDCVAMLNSTVHNKLITDLNLTAYKHAYIWLDWDARVKAIKASHKLQALGVNASSIRTPKDPKAIPYKELKL